MVDSVIRTALVAMILGTCVSLRLDPSGLMIANIPPPCSTIPLSGFGIAIVDIAPEAVPNEPSSSQSFRPGYFPIRLPLTCRPRCSESNPNRRICKKTPAAKLDLPIEATWKPRERAARDAAGAGTQIQDRRQVEGREASTVEGTS